jgi:hypothetical protein
MYHVAPYGKHLGYEDVFTKIYCTGLILKTLALVPISYSNMFAEL